MRWPIIFFVALLLSAAPIQGLAASATQVQILSSTGDVITSFVPFDDALDVGGIASADLGSDGAAEILVGGGKHMQPVVGVYRQDGSKIGQFLAYESTFTRGVTVAACDVTGDGIAEIITGVQLGGGPHVRVFTNMGDPLSPGFFAYDESFRGGVNVACGDVDGDGVGEIVTSPGVTGGPHIKAFNEDGSLAYEFFASNLPHNGGASLAVVNTDGDDNLEITIASLAPHTQTVIVLDVVDKQLIAQSTISSATTSTGTSVFGFDDDRDGIDSIGITSGAHATPSLIVDEQIFSPFSSTDTLNVIAARVPHSSERIVVANGTTALNDDVSAQSILVDISEQKLTAFEYGIPVNEFLVSTGRTIYPTPVGKTQVYNKLLYHDYIWSFGENHPENYAVRGVKYNLRIYKHIYIHYVWWHNKFGTRQSHGCINANYENSEWIYNWANVGTPVNIIN